MELRTPGGRGARRRKRGSVDGVDRLSAATALTAAQRGPGEVEVARIAELLRERAPGYFDEFRGSDVSATLDEGRQRRYSTIYRFELSAGQARRSVFVKLPPPGDQARGPRPRATPAASPGRTLALYHTALNSTHAHFAQLNDPRFGAVRALDLITEIDAIVMEEAEGDQLWKLLPGASRLRPLSSVDLDDAFRNAGGWLREFHGLERGRRLARVHDGYPGFVELLTALTQFLGASLGEPAYFDHVAARTRGLAERILTEPPPLGVHFGDYGLTNVLVAPDARVTAIDTLANWYTPIYVDVAYFLTGIKTYRRQIATQGLAFNRERLAAFEREFLAGYFGPATLPIREIRLYEVLRLLERWSGRLARNSRRSLPGQKVGLVMVNRFFRKTLRDLVYDLEES